MDSEEVMILISGYGKAHALKQCVEEGVNHFWTVSMLQLHRHGIIVCDEDSTMELKVSTVKYFKDIEREHLNLEIE
jgi:glucosamine-6-phosphate deaminase